MITKKRLIKGTCLVIIGFAVNSCFSVKYSMTGASIPPEMKTISVQYFPNRAATVNPMLSQQLTDALRNKFLAQTKLTMINDIGDANFEGEIQGYDVRPMAIQGTDIAALDRFTITIKVKYTNTIDPKLNFEATFSRYEDFSSSSSFPSVEASLVTAILDLLTEDVFNKAFANW